MSRKSLILQNQFPYYVTSRCRGAEWYYIGLDSCWEICTMQLEAVTAKYQTHIYAFVLMSNHFHLILDTPQANLGDVMRDFLTGTSKAILRQAGRKNSVFGTPYRWSLLNSARSVAYVYKYALRNPVRAGMVSNVAFYRYSHIHPQAPKRLSYVCGISPIWVHVPRDRESQVTWANGESITRVEKLIRMGLRRREFRFSKDHNYRGDLRSLRSSYGIE